MVVAICEQFDVSSSLWFLTGRYNTSNQLVDFSTSLYT